MKISKIIVLMSLMVIAAPVYASEVNTQSECDACYLKMINSLKEKQLKLVEECCKLTDVAKTQKEAEIKEVQESITYLEELNAGRNIIEKIKALETKTKVAIGVGAVATIVGIIGVWKFAQWIYNLNSTNKTLTTDREQLRNSNNQKDQQITALGTQVNALNDIVVHLNQDMNAAKKEAVTLSLKMINQEQSYKNMNEETKKLQAIYSDLNKNQPKLLKKYVQKYYAEHKKPENNKKVVDTKNAIIEKK